MVEKSLTQTTVFDRYDRRCGSISDLKYVAHFRKATGGALSISNTHPFQFRDWIFAHNGTLENFSPRLGGHYQPVGTTDSELAFCYLLETLRLAFPHGEPGLAALRALGESSDPLVQTFTESSPWRRNS